MKSRIETDVLIVGAGPTGLMMALQLQRQGVRFELIERRPDRSMESRALVIHAKSMELFQNLGLAPVFLKAARTSIGFEIFTNGHRRLQMDFGDIGAKDTPFSSVFFLAQSETERLLREELATCGCKIRSSTELLSFSQDSQNVLAQIREANGSTDEIKATYLVGCDGAHSAVRHGLNLPFDGAPYAEDFLLADAQIEWPHSNERLSIFLTRHGVMAHFPLTQKIGRLIITAGLRGVDAPEAPTLSEIADKAATFSGSSVRLSDPQWLARFRLHHRVVPQYQVGPVFLAGDAAHIHSPAGGQGMNTGLQDASNLAWKIAWVLKGARPALLESYQNERHRIAEVLLKTTDRFFRMAASQNLFAALIRLHLLPHLAQFILSKPERRRRAFRIVSQLAIHYHESPFVHDDISRADDTFALGPQAGCRAPDAPLENSTLFAQMLAPQATVLLFGKAEQPLLPAAFAPQIRVLSFSPIAAHGTLFERYGVKDSAVYFVRPDGYIGYRSCGRDGRGLQAYLEGFLPSALNESQSKS